MGAYAVVFAAAVLAASPPPAATLKEGPMSAVADNAGARGFDFEFGAWRVHHHVLGADGSWKDFEGTSNCRPLMDGSGNVEDNIFFRPTGNTYGVAVRAYDAKTGLWAIWWVDSRDPHLPMDPPVKGRFENGVGAFYSDGLVNGVATRTRYLWSHITPTSARWEQALSTDGGKTWSTNWIMDFSRAT